MYSEFQCLCLTSFKCKTIKCGCFGCAGFSVVGNSCNAIITTLTRDNTNTNNTTDPSSRQYYYTVLLDKSTTQY